MFFYAGGSWTSKYAARSRKGTRAHRVFSTRAFRQHMRAWCFFYYERALVVRTQAWMLSGSKHNNFPRKGIAQGDRLKATNSIGVTAMFPNLKWIPRKHKPCMEDLHNMMQTRTIFLGKSDLVKISWPLQQCATWLASHPPPASSNALQYVLVTV